MVKIICKDCNNKMLYYYIENGYRVYKCYNCKKEKKIKTTKKIITFKQKLKVLLWKLDLYPETKCPICSKKLLKTGFPNEITGRQYYRCINDYCLFN